MSVSGSTPSDRTFVPIAQPAVAPRTLAAVPRTLAAQLAQLSASLPQSLATLALFGAEPARNLLSLGS